MSDCLSGLKIIDRVWREKKSVYRKLQNGEVSEAITNVREALGSVIFMRIPSHVGIVPNTIADNIAAKEETEAPKGMITGLISKQVRSRPIIYNGKVKGYMELADGPIYQEARKRRGKVVRDMHYKPPEGGDKCEGAVARGMMSACKAEDEEDSDREMDIERKVGER
eukprot:1584467-Pleurochrysis_carterae.AAC.4